MAGKLIDNDKGFKKLINNIQKMRGKHHVAVGVLQDAVATDGDNFDMAHLAAVHEFGSANGHIPQRSFLRGTHDEKLNENRKLIKSLQRDALHGELSVDSALTRLGEVAKGQVLEKINSRELKANASSTIRQKKSSTPLVDKGRLKESITFEVRK